MMKPAVFVVDPYHDVAIAKLREIEQIDLVLPDDARRKNFLEEADAILIRSQTKLTADDIAKANGNLKYIVKQGTGLDNIDLNAAQARNIKVFNTPGVNSEAVAELTIGLAFCVSRRINEVDRMIRNGDRVIRSQLLGKSLHKKTLGIVGMGNIGLEVAKKWRGVVDGALVGFDPHAKQDAWSEHFAPSVFRRADNLDELLKSSDVVSLHVPLVASTRNLISERQFSIMKEDAILLNCARGGIVDEDALLEALRSGRLYGAGLDALQHEPPSSSHYGDSLLTHPRVIMTPHVGASTEETQEKSGVMAVQILLDLLQLKI